MPIRGGKLAPVEYNISARGRNEGLEARLTQAARCADALARDILAQRGDADAVRCGVAEYVRLRYGLEPGDMGESLNYLGEVSLARGLGMTVDEVRRSELDSKCENTSSSMTKKILLVIALNRALGVNIDPQQTAEIATVSALGDEVARQLATMGEF